MITAEQEQEKYRRMWTDVLGYRKTSPGERLVPTFLEQADWHKGDTLLDAGCGPGRAGLALRLAGFQVTLLDITEKSVDSESRGILPFIQGCLWDVKADLILPFNWVYCCDVLEHIPPEHVDAVLDNLAKLSVNGAFLQIALWEDGWGNKIGETLHLTVRPAEWWLDKILARWSINWQADSGDGRLIVLTGSPR